MKKTIAMLAVAAAVASCSRVAMGSSVGIYAREAYGGAPGAGYIYPNDTRRRVEGIFYTGATYHRARADDVEDAVFGGTDCGGGMYVEPSPLVPDDDDD